MTTYRQPSSAAAPALLTIKAARRGGRALVALTYVGIVLACIGIALYVIAFYALYDLVRWAVTRKRPSTEGIRAVVAKLLEVTR